MNAQAQTDKTTFPGIARCLGYAGVIPFVLLAVSIAAGIDLSGFGLTDASGKLLGYGAVIISFIGAVHWGVALQSESHRQSALYAYSVIPALVAWVWLFFTVKIALIGMAITVAVMYFVDRALLTGLVSSAYLSMRLHLTVTVSVSLLLAAIRAV